jgi:hypothetical protein
MVPVFAVTIERVQQLAMSLESRAFGSKGLKTSLRNMRASAKDFVFALLGVALTAAGVYLLQVNSAALDWSERSFIPAWVSVAIVALAATTFLVFTITLWRRAAQE